MPRLPQQITKGRRPGAAVEFCLYRFMLAACGVVFEATGETAREKKEATGAAKGKGGGAKRKGGRNGGREKKRFVEGIDATKHRSGFDESN